ncbi:MAG: peptidoglycan DD-metalloendopeptidase family protein, partial [candidate division WOR-3 bacterium]|nr:peptidoglycan DD-metalloendopeptidase family protein [candidate division WOR-3 bacterium]
IDATRRELEKTQERLRAVQNKIDALEKEEKGILKRIEAYDEKITLTKKYIKELTVAQKLKQTEINKINTQLKETQNKIVSSQKDLGKVLLTFYKQRLIFPTEILLSNKSMPDVYKKAVFLKFIANDQKRIIKEFRGLKKNLELQQKQLIAAKEQLIKYKQEREEEIKNLNNLQSLENKILNKVRKERTQNEMLQEELKAAAAKLEKLIAELETKRQARKLAPGTHYLEIMKGNLPWPYYGEVIAKFGTQENPKYNTKIKNTGIDIKTPNDAKIRAIAQGRVVYADRFMGYGNMIILDHSDGYYSLYSNLAEMNCSVGMTVEQGEVIGSAKDFLHFELRCEGKPVDPLFWLSR